MRCRSWFHFADLLRGVSLAVFDAHREADSGQRRMRLVLITSSQSWDGRVVGIVTLLHSLRREAIELPMDFPSQRAMDATRSLRIAFAIMACCYTLLTLCCIFIISERRLRALMWETRHFLHRTRLMDVYGLRPYPRLRLSTDLF